jgi:hypothetical protein
MKKRTSPAFTLVILLLLAATCAYAQTPAPAAKTDDNDFYVRNFNGKPGEWAAIIRNDKIHIEFAGLHWNTGRQFLVSEFGNLPAGQPGSFRLQREAGTIVFEGVFNSSSGKGTYKFEENQAFKSFLANQGFSNISPELMLNIFFTNINTAYFDFLKSNGYLPITMDQLKDLAEQDISRQVLEEDLAFFSKQGYGKVGLDKIITWREHGVNPAFVNSFLNAGYKDISLDQATTLRDHGVNMAFISGFDVKNIPLEKAIELRDHGVKPEYIKALHDLGWKDISLETATELRDHGVDVPFVKALQAAGYSDISAERAKDLRDHGVDASFISSFKEIGFKDITLERAQQLRDHGVTAAYIKKMQQKGLVNLSLDEYQKLRNAGM